MCAICGVADASHDALIMRGAMLLSSSGMLMLPKAWFARLKRLVVRQG